MPKIEETEKNEKEKTNTLVKKRLKTDLTVDDHIIQLFAFDYNQKHPVIGTDEAGRGPAAGGVFASAVCFHQTDRALIEKLMPLNDSKQLTKKKREALYDIILENSLNATVCIEVEEIEQINILNASLKAMRLACLDVIKQLQVIQNLEALPELSGNESDEGFKLIPYNGIMTLVDGNKMIPDYQYSQRWVIKGDSRSAAIAAASILAKVTRDRYMERLDAEYPQYGWAKNAGYLTKEHLDAIDKYGLTPYHRPSFLKKHFAKQEQLSLF